MSTSRSKFWGWGTEGVHPDKKFMDRLTNTLSVLFEVDASYFKVRNPPNLDEIATKMRAPRFHLPDLLKKISSDSTYDRALHSYGRSFRDVVRALSGQFDNPPDYVVYPTSEQEIMSVMKFCEEQRVALIPFGGGSSVTGGVEPTNDNWYKGVITLSMKHFNRIKQIDKQSSTALIQAGMFGPALENELKKDGLTLRHFPQSFEFSTLGGWIATRGGGHFATLYTHIDEFVESVRVVTPRGVIVTNRFPGNGAGPEPNRLFVGSEGILGVITEAWMRVQERPKYRTTVTVQFETFMAGVQAVRKISQSGINPSNCRLVDGMEAMQMGLGVGNTVLILGFESARINNFDVPLHSALQYCKECGGRWNPSSVQTKSDSGSRDGAAEEWKKNFLMAPYVRDTLIQMGVIVETFETSCTWDQFPTMHQKIQQATQEALDKYCEGKGMITCRFTHTYPDGPAPYYSIIAKGKQGHMVEQWDNIKRIVSAVLVECNATITHHHSVGKDHLPYYQQQINPIFQQMLINAKLSVDHNWILNPGKKK